MNTTTRFFQNKEQYLAFRNAFAAGQKDKRANKTYSSATGKRWNEKTRSSEEYTYRYKNDGWLCSTHYLLFNLVCGKDYYNGFTPKMRKAFVENRGDPDRALSAAISHLSSLIDAARTLLGMNEIQAPSWIKDKKQYTADRMNTLQNQINTFLEPLGGVFTLQDLVRVQLPSFPGLTQDQITEHTGKQVSYKQLLGPSVADQTPDEDDIAPTTPPREAVAGDICMMPEKKGFFKKLFGV